MLKSLPITVGSRATESPTPTGPGSSSLGGRQQAHNLSEREGMPITLSGLHWRPVWRVVHLFCASDPLHSVYKPYIDFSWEKNLYWIQTIVLKTRKEKKGTGQTGTEIGRWFPSTDVFNAFCLQSTQNSHLFKINWSLSVQLNHLRQWWH